jgi:hypothetical protein
VCCGGKGEAVLNDVRTVIRYRADVGGLHLGSTPTVDDAQSRHGAPNIIGLANLQSEVCITDLSAQQLSFGGCRRLKSMK